MAPLPGIKVPVTQRVPVIVRVSPLPTVRFPVILPGPNDLFSSMLTSPPPSTIPSASAAASQPLNIAGVIGKLIGEITVEAPKQLYVSTFKPTSVPERLLPEPEIVAEPVILPKPEILALAKTLPTTLLSLWSMLTPPLDKLGLPM